jgi:hypothetical protein
MEKIRTRETVRGGLLHHECQYKFFKHKIIILTIVFIKQCVMDVEIELYQQHLMFQDVHHLLGA